jgi:hypothetical protein
MPGSEAFKLHQESNFRKLDEHMKMLDAKQHALEGTVPMKNQVGHPL